ncbi:MAG: YihY/virulence factor BrkB family protein [Kiritimatiellae bacterium]|nr:YihY/virulence factor BrkB family protein [Kiritimatiellia bacterium]
MSETTSKFSQTAKRLQTVRKILHEPVLTNDPKSIRVSKRVAQPALAIFRSFKKDKCPLHAASLTFFSLMALVPVLALVLSMARAFGGAELAKSKINQQIDSLIAQMEQAVTKNAEAAKAQAEEKPAPQAEAAPQEKRERTDTGEAPGDPEAKVGAEAPSQEAMANAFAAQVREISNRILAQIDNIGFGTLGGIGAVMLIWMAIGVLGKVESSFNDIWGVEKPRTLYRKVSDYLFAIMILPFLMIAASTIPVVTQVTRFMDKTVGGRVAVFFRTLVESGFTKIAVTLMLGTLVFAFLLGFMPNTKVKPLPALCGGFITALLFGLWFKLCTMLQIGIGNYSKLYGGFAALPILLGWFNVSWQIILLGGEIVFAIQNRTTYGIEELASTASVRARFLLALAFCIETAKFAKRKDGGPFSVETFARDRHLPVRLVQNILEDLTRNKILVAIADQPGSYLLCKCGSSITVAELIKVLMEDGAAPEELGLQNLDRNIWAVDQQLGQHLDAQFAQTLTSL